MKKNNFFKNSIKDNNYKGLDLSLIRQTKKTGDKSEKNIFKFLKNIESKFSSVDIKELVHTISFGKEFDANDKQKLFEVRGNDFSTAKIYTFNIVGSIFYNQQTFNINSRFGNEFLQYMIASANGFLELENAGGVNNDISVAEWLMIYYFKIKLKSAFALGMYKTYATFNDNLNRVRGQIDINQYLKKEYFDGKTKCIYKEHSFSNEINYVISLAINKIFKNNKYLPIVQDIHIIKNAFNQVEYKKQNINFLKTSKIKNPFYSTYNEVFSLAFNILNDDYGANSEEDFSAFLFDISLLFEHHIRTLLKTKFSLDEKNKKEYKVPNGSYYSAIYPDIIIHNNDNSISIYDVKYKNFRGEVDRNDRFQLISYVAMYLKGYNIRECGFIYPNSSQKNSNKEQILKIADKAIPFKIIFYDISEISNIQNNNDGDKFQYFKESQKEQDVNFLKNFIIKT